MALDPLSNLIAGSNPAEALFCVGISTVLCFCVQVEASRRIGLLSKESYQMSKYL
jgi:hypothetical protein